MVCALTLCFTSFILKPVTGNFTRLSLARAHSTLLPTSHRGTSFGTKSAQKWTNKTKISVSPELFWVMLLFTQLLLWPASCCTFPAQSSRSWAGPAGLNRVRKCLKFSRVMCGQELHVSFVKTRGLSASSDFGLVSLGGSSFTLSVYLAFNPSASHVFWWFCCWTLSSANKASCWFYGGVTQCRSIKLFLLYWCKES